MYNSYQVDETYVVYWLCDLDLKKSEEKNYRNVLCLMEIARDVTVTISVFPKGSILRLSKEGGGE